VKFLLGIDLGTTGCKGALYDRYGNMAAQSYREHRIITPARGYVEEDPDDWWENTVEVIKDILAQKEEAKKNISGMGISGTNALLPVDIDGNPLMNAIMQLDLRTTTIIEEMKKIQPPEVIFAATGNRHAPGTVSAPAILWLKKNCPGIYDKTYKFLVPAGFIVNKLTGKFTIDFSRASTTSLFNLKKEAWDEELLCSFQVSRDKLPEVFHSHDIVGHVTRQAAELTGLQEGIPVIAGAMDTVSAGIGIGSIDTSEPFLIMGTVGRICIPLREQVFDDRFFNSYNTINLPYLAMAPINAAGNSMKWFRDAFGHREAEIAEQQGISVYEIFADLAKDSQLGSGGLLYLPYISGERSPHWDACARGLFFGITTGHGKKEFIRAIMEGVSFALRNNLQIMKSVYRQELNKLRIGGGCARSEVWRQIIANALNVELLQTDHPEGETLGAAILAGVGVGEFSSIQSAVEKIVNITAKTAPDGDKHQEYGGYYDIFTTLYSLLSDQFVLLNLLVSKGGEIRR